MSTRHARVADKELNDKHTRILVELLQRVENKTCADCKKKDPRWASWNLGIFICIRCSGTHRSLGTHISKVKSVDLDTWTPEQIENMIKWGNQRANIYWEANLNDRRPTENSMDVWIRAKYEQKKWVAKDDLPNPSKIVLDSSQKKEDVKPIKEEETIVKTTITKDHSKEFGLLYHTSVNSNKTLEKKDTTTIAKSSPVKSMTDKQQEGQINVQSAIPVTTTSSGYKIDMSSFQEQLSGLSLGRPSSGLIPQAPPGSNTSWTNFLINQSSKSSEIAISTPLAQAPLEKPLIPYDTFASLRR